MADNTAQNGTDTLRTLDRTGVKTGVSLLDIAQSGESELMGLGDSRTLSFTSAGLTTATTAYTAGDQLGTELSLSTAVRTGKGLILVSGAIIDEADILGAVDLFIFNAATTPASDNAANSWSDADIAKCLYVVHFNDVIDSALNRVLVPTNLPAVLKPASGTTLYADLVTRTGHTFFGAVGNIKGLLGVQPD